MVEKKKSGYWLTHLGLILGVLFIFFPVWLTFVASTSTQDAILQPPLPMLPGGEFFENYAKAHVKVSERGQEENLLSEFDSDDVVDGGYTENKGEHWASSVGIGNNNAF